MSTKTLLDSIVARASSGWNRSTGTRSILSKVAEGQDALINTLGERRIWRGSDNLGFPPYLKTVAGTYTYEIKGSNLSSGTITLLLGGTSYTVVADLVRRIYTGDAEAQTECDIAVETMPALGSANPTVIFPFDPGTEDTKYFVEFYWRAPRLVSESIPLVVPLEFERALEEYVVAYMQECENGAVSDFTNKFESFWKPEFARKFKSAGRLRNNKVILRAC